MRHITKAKAAIGGLSSVVVMAAALLSIVNGVWTDEERGDAPSTPTPTPYSVILPELSAGLTPPSPFATQLTQPLPTTAPTPTTPEPTVPAADSATAIDAAGFRDSLPGLTPPPHSCRRWFSAGHAGRRLHCLTDTHALTCPNADGNLVTD